MANEPGKVNIIPRLETGLDVLDEWAATASQTKKNAIYEALFAMQDGSLFRTYRIVDDFQQLSELFVVVRDDLVLKIRVNSSDSFGIVSIGHLADLPAGGGHAA